MLVLGLDTASATTSVAVAEYPGTAHTPTGYRVCAAVDIVDSRRPAEQLAPAIERALQQAGVRIGEVDLVAVGVGPGPFTGLRAGLVTARVLGGTLSKPVVGVVSLDALAFAAADGSLAGGPTDFVVATDARRREVYWATYLSGERTQGPAVATPVDVPTSGRPVVGRGAEIYRDVLGPRVGDILDPPAWAVAVLAARSHGSGRELPPDPLYLRRPDVAAPAPRKPVVAR